MNAQTLRGLSFFILASSLVAAPPACAATLEIAGYAGLSLPFYEQTFTVSLVPPANALPGVALRQERPLSLNARSGLVLAGGATVYFGGVLGIEARYDSATVDITSDPPLYSVTLSRPLPNLQFTLEPAPTVITVSSLTPVSLNLKLRTPGPLGLFFSGGVSYLPDFQLAVRQKLDVSIAGIPLPPGVDLGSLSASAVTRPEDPENGRLGGNVGLGLQIKLGEHVALVGEGRAFFFPKQILTWSVSQQRGLVTLPSEVTTALEQQLEPIRFNPAYFHLVGGLAFTF
jgi:hypothetical protein